MVDTPLTASSIQLFDKSSGWMCRIAPDERLPDDVWAIDAEMFAFYTAKSSDTPTYYAQTKWMIERFATEKWLILGPKEDGQWLIVFPNGTSDLAFVLSKIEGTLDLRNAAKWLRRGDGTYPVADPDAGRILPGPYV